MSDPTPEPLPGVRVGQLRRAKQLQQRLQYLRITSVDNRYAYGDLSVTPDGPTRTTRLLRDDVPQRYRLVSEGGDDA